jgi:hypothetical protein
MRVIRRGVFETNSSSTHSLTLCSKEDYDKWSKGEMLCGDGTLFTREEAINELKTDKWFNKRNPNFDFTDEDAVNEALRDNDYKTCDEYFDDEYLETFENTYTTKSGEKVVAFGKYGYDN